METPAPDTLRSKRRIAIAICAVIAFVSLTFPSYFAKKGYNSQKAGRYFFTNHDATINWSQTIHGFLWASILCVVVFWWFPRNFTFRSSKLPKEPTSAQIQPLDKLRPVLRNTYDTLRVILAVFLVLGLALAVLFEFIGSFNHSD